MAAHDDIAKVVAGLAKAGTKPERGKEAIPAAKAAGPSIGEAKGTGLGGGTDPLNAGGIASPLTETAFEDRTFHPDEIMTTSDGIFTASLRRTKKVTFTDDNDDSVAIILKAPV
jgi:hypothetical protein